MGRRAVVLSRGDAGQSGVAAMSVVINLIAVQLSFKIALVPKQSLIEVFTPDGPDQSLDESMRTGCAGDGLDLIDLKDPKVRQPALKTKKRIVIRGKIFRHALSRDRVVEQPAHARPVCGEFQFRRQPGSERGRCSVGASDMNPRRAVGGEGAPLL
jgi:hypothetical protein